ncbi:hypothetical protein INT47_011235 [Mucor saturninus]|uniref:SHSP domain-containing protein n=1 Tax=Mucor saturninus TaxID=64648 RepID=A0A8H7RL05_9FUNG|nr:hypothetical protein INT47_011235 [Mucor saturninus]
MATGQRLFTDAFRDMQRAVETFRSGSYPPSDVIDHAEYFTLEAELPGYTKNNIKFEVVDTRTLILSGSLNDDEYEAHHQSDSSRTVHCEAHGKSAGPVCKSCEAGLIKAEEAQERLAKDAQAVKVEQAQAAQKAAQVETAQKNKEAQQAGMATAAQATKATDSQKSMMEKAKDVVNTQAKKLESKVKKSEAEEAKKAEEVEAQKVEETQAKKAQDTQTEDTEKKKAQEAKAKDDEYQREQAQAQKEQQEVEKSRQRKAQYLIRERNPAESFSRQYNFHTHIKSEGIKARFQDGILKAIVPKVNIEKHQQINID